MNTDRFWSRVERTPTCWLWRGPLLRSGYGTNSPHRTAYRLVKGPIPDGLLLRHSCDVRACVNPDHLTPGTPKENAQDRSVRGRSGKRSEYYDPTVLVVRAVKTDHWKEVRKEAIDRDLPVGEVLNEILRAWVTGRRAKGQP